MKHWLFILILILVVSCSQSPNKTGGQIIDKKEIIYWDPVIQQYITKYNIKLSINGSKVCWITNQNLYNIKNIGDTIWFVENEFPYSLKIKGE